jgi:hypothetical protein
MSAPEQPDARTSVATTAWEETGVVPTLRDLIGITLGDFQVERRLGRLPGYFPGFSQWAAQASIQLARTLLRHHGDERLKVLAGEIIRWNKSKTHEKDLANIMLTAVKALNGDLDGVVTDLNQTWTPARSPTPR